MKLPKGLLDREAIFNDLVSRCLTSRQSRKANYERLRNYYLFGADGDADQAKYNKIYPSVDLLSSFLFAADTTRFNIKLGTSAPKEEISKIPPLIQRLNDKWQDSNADGVFGMGVNWALVYNTMLVKLIQKDKDTYPFLIEPHNFGVLREELTMLDRQEAFVHCFMTTRPQLERDLDGHSRKESIMKRLSARPREESVLPAGVQRIIVNGQYPLAGEMTGNVNDVLSGSEMYRPMTQEELLEMYELWVWNDEARDGEGDYQVVTMADPDICIYDRPAGRDMFMAGDHPFTAITPNPAPDYFWGHSEVSRLTALQDLREKHLMQIDRLVDLNVDSPKALKGMWASPDEKQLALSRLGAILSSADPTADIKEFKVEIPSDIWAVVNKIDEMFDESISLNNLSKGHGDTGVRSKGQTDSLLRVGSSRPKKRAMVIEDSLERIATQYLKLDQQHNPESMIEEGESHDEFISEQFTDDFMVKVDAHSSSPIFVEDQKSLAFDLYKAKVIDGESLLDLLQPQNVQVLKERYKKMAAAQSAHQAKEDALHEKEVESKVTKIHAQG